MLKWKTSDPATFLAQNEKVLKVLCTTWNEATCFTLASDRSGPLGTHYLAPEQNVEEFIPAIQFVVTRPNQTVEGLLRCDSPFDPMDDGVRNGYLLIHPPDLARMPDDLPHPFSAVQKAYGLV